MSRPRLWDYLKAAFNARPRGMWFAPNWGLVGASILLGFINPGLWLIGGGLELGYLALMISSKRFRRLVNAKWESKHRDEWTGKLNQAIAQLGESDRRQYADLERRCRAVLDEAKDSSSEAISFQAEGLGRLLWIYLQLLLTRRSVVRALESSLGSGKRGDSLDAKLEELQAALAKRNLSPELARSLEGQREILEQRIATRSEASGKLQFIESELRRIDEQVALIREQSLLSGEAEAVSHRIDAVSSTLGDTTSWIRDQRRIYGMVDPLEGAPPVMLSEAS